MAELIQIFYQPGKVFDQVREKRIWVFALIANMLLIALFSGILQEAIGMTNMARQQMEGSSFTKNLTAEQKEAAIAAADTPTRKVIGIVAAGLVIGVMLLFFALLFMAVAGMSGGPMKFSQALGTACYVAWPFSLITAVLSILVVYISPDRSVLDPQHLLAFNVGAFLDKTTTSKPLYALASSFDVLLFAQMAFAGWGLARVAQIPFARALGGVIGIWVLFTAIRMGFSLVF